MGLTQTASGSDYLVQIRSIFGVDMLPDRLEELVPMPMSQNEWKIKRTLGEIQREIEGGRSNNKIEIYMNVLRNCVTYNVWD